MPTVSINDRLGSAGLGGVALTPRQVDQTSSRAFNTTYTNTGTGSLFVQATFRAIVTLAAGSSTAQGKSDTATPPTIIATGVVGIQSGLLNEDNTFQISFFVSPGKTYIINSVVANATATLGSWFEAAL